MAYPEEQAVEVIYETPAGTVRDLGTEPHSGFPSTIIRDGRLFRLVAQEIISQSGELTHLRVRYRQQDGCAG